MPRTEKKYEVIAEFSRQDKRTGEFTHYAVGDTYSGPDVERYLKGVDDTGPLIREITTSEES